MAVSLPMKKDDKAETPINRLIHFNERYNNNNHNNNAGNCAGKLDSAAAVAAAMNTIMTARNCEGIPLTKDATAATFPKDFNDYIPQSQQLQTRDFSGNNRLAGGNNTSISDAESENIANCLSDPTTHFMFPQQYYTGNSNSLASTLAAAAASNAAQTPTMTTIAAAAAAAAAAVVPSPSRHSHQLISPAALADTDRSASIMSSLTSYFPPQSPNSNFTSTWPWYQNGSSSSTNCAAAAFLSGYGNSLISPPAAVAAAAAAAAAVSNSSNPYTNNNSNNVPHNSSYFSAPTLSFSGFLPSTSIPVSTSSHSSPFSTSVDGNNNNGINANNIGVASSSTASSMPPLPNLNLSLSPTNFHCFGALPSPSSMTYLNSAVSHSQNLLHPQPRMLQHQQNQQHLSPQPSHHLTSLRSKNVKICNGSNAANESISAKKALELSILSSSSSTSSATSVRNSHATSTAATASEANSTVARNVNTIAIGGTRNGEVTERGSINTTQSFAIRTNCECPNCQELQRSGTPSDRRQEQRHNCHIPGCHKVYGKSSHLKAHLRWHCQERPSKKRRMDSLMCAPTSTSPFE